MKIWYLIKKEFIEIFSQKQLVFLMFVAPLIQILIFGYIATTDIKHLPIKIENLSKSKYSKEIVNRILNTNLFDVKEISERDDNNFEILRRGEVKAIIIIKDDYDTKKSFLKFPRVEILLDGVDSNTSLIAAGYFNGIIKEFIIKDISKKGKVPLISSKPLIRYNSDLRSINYMGPGIVAMLLTVVGLFISSGAIVKEKEQQTIDTLMISGLKPIEIYIGKALPILIIGLMNMGIGILLVTLWFEISIKGSLFYLLFSAIIYLIAIISYGIFISIITNTQQESMFFGWFSMITFIYLSGLLTPIENIPNWLKWLSFINPLMYLIKIIREIFLKGNGIEYFYNDLFILTIISLIIITISIVNFRKFMSN